MSKISKELLYELTKEPEEKKISMQDFAKRLLIGFFVMMILLTTISRAADSVTIAKITVGSVKQGVLKFEIEGIGNLEEKAEKYLDIYAGVRVADICVKEGQKVEKDDILLYYDTKDLEEILYDFEDELSKIELNLQKDKLNYEVENAGTAKEAAELMLERAKIDLLTAKEDLKLAKKLIKKEKKEALKIAEQNYYDMNDTFTDQDEKMSKEIQQLNKKVLQAEEKLDELYIKKTKIEAVLSSLKTAIISNNPEYIHSAEINMFKEYYGEVEYEKHEKLIANAQKVLSRANEDYWNAIMIAAEEGRFLSTTEKASLNRAIMDAEEEVIELKSKDNEILKASTEYRNAIQSNNLEHINNTYSTLLSLLYTEDDGMKKLVETAKDDITKAKEELNDTTLEWEKTMEKEEEAVTKVLEVLNKAQAVYTQITDNTYDYSVEVKLELSQIEIAQRTVEDAMNHLNDAKKLDDEVLIKNESNKKIEKLNLEIYEIDIKEKKEKITEIKNILNNQGKLLSPVNGILIKLGVEIGSTTLGTEKVSIALNDYEFEAKITKEEAKRLAVGDEISLQLGNSKEKIKIPIEDISIEDTEGKCKITGIMPIGDYSLGSAISFKISKQSELYRQTIPIQALRTDSKGKSYVLVSREMDTMLGKELTAYPIYVTLLDKDYFIAAIEININSEDVIIVGSNKYIEEGDRVRVSESNDKEN